MGQGDILWDNENMLESQFRRFRFLSILLKHHHHPPLLTSTSSRLPFLRLKSLIPAASWSRNVHHPSIATQPPPKGVVY